MRGIMLLMSTIKHGYKLSTSKQSYEHHNKCTGEKKTLPVANRQGTIHQSSTKRLAPAYLLEYLVHQIIHQEHPARWHQGYWVSENELVELVDQFQATVLHTSN